MGNEQKIMNALYMKGKRNSEGIVYEALLYDLHDILKEIQLSEDEVIPSLKNSFQSTILNGTDKR